MIKDKSMVDEQIGKEELPVGEQGRFKRKQMWLEHFEKLAPTFRKYRNRFKYYWNDVVRYYNYFLLDDKSILQIGCGTGDTLAQLKGSRKVGVDISPMMISEAKAAYQGLEFHVREAEDIGLDEKFDVIVLSNIIGYFENVLDVFEEVKKYTHPRSKIFVSYYSSLWKPFINLAEMLGIKKKSPDQNWLSKGDIENLLYLAGFESYRSNTRMLLPFNIPIISWFVNKYIAKLPFINNLCLAQHVFARHQASTEVNSNFTVSICVPTRNESGNIEDAILRTPELGKWTELIFIEGNSTDDTWEKVQEMQKKYGNTRRIKIGQQDGKGKYNAVKKGYAMAEGDILMILDGDLTVPPEDLPKFYDALASGKGGFINGSRLVYPMESEAMRFLNMLGNKFFSYCFSWLLEQPVKDTLCGTKVMFREDYERLAANRKFFGDFDPFGDFDLLFGSYKLNLKIIDLPIRYRDRTYGDTNISRWSHGVVLLRMVIFAMNKIKFY